MITIRKKLRSIAVGGGSLARILVTVGTEPIVLFQKEHPILKPKFSQSEWEVFAAELIADHASQQQLRDWNRHNRYAFNCHTFSIGRLFGLGPEYWLEGSRSVFTLMENPTQTLLDVYFHEVQQASLVEGVNKAMHQDDVVVFRDGETGDLVHSGLIRNGDGRLGVLSKLGEHAVAFATLDALAHEYRGQFDSLHLFRPKKETLRRQRTQVLRPLQLVHG